MFGIQMFVTPCPAAGRYFYAGGVLMQAQLYFLSNPYYVDFPDDKLMKNKELVNGIPQTAHVFSLSSTQIVPKSIELFRFHPNTKNTARLSKKKSRNMVVAIPYASAPSLTVILHS